MYSTETLDWLWHSRRRVCRYCGCALLRVRRRMNRAPPLNTATADHLLPRERGGVAGRNEGYWNVTLCCYLCNQLRAEAGHCPGALACAKAVLRRGIRPGDVTRWFRLPY